MANKSKAKGTRAETKVVRFLEEHGIECFRKALAGSADEGDIQIVGRDIILEVKAGKQAANPCRSQHEEWMQQTLVEMRNSKSQHAALVVVRYQRSLTDAEVYLRTEGKQGTHFMYLDEFADWLRYGRLK